MERKLRLYLWWKGKLGERKKEGKGPFWMPDKSADTLGGGEGGGVTEAMRKKDATMKDRGASRRRLRGGTPGGASSSGGNTNRKDKEIVVGENDMREEAETIAELSVPLSLHCTATNMTTA